MFFKTLTVLLLFFTVEFCKTSFFVFLYDLAAGINKTVKEVFPGLFIQVSYLNIITCIVNFTHYRIPLFTVSVVYHKSTDIQGNMSTTMYGHVVIYNNFIAILYSNTYIITR